VTNTSAGNGAPAGQSSASSAAASSPPWPGMRMSKNSTSGRSASASRTADAPSPTMAAMRSSGQARGQFGLQRLRQQRLVLGDQGGGGGHAVVRQAGGCGAGAAWRRVRA
jgi:hypothetical protein